MLIYLQRYPLDRQKCSIFIESFKLSAKDISLSWLPDPVYMSTTPNWNSFISEGYELENCTQQFLEVAFPCLELIFQFKRQLGYFILQVVYFFYEICVCSGYLMKQCILVFPCELTYLIFQSNKCIYICVHYVGQCISSRDHYMSLKQ